MGYVIPLFTIIKHHRNLEIYLRFTVFVVFFVDFDGKLVGKYTIPIPYRIHDWYIYLHLP